MTGIQEESIGLSTSKKDLQVNCKNVDYCVNDGRPLKSYRKATGFYLGFRKMTPVAVGR